MVRFLGGNWFAGCCMTVLVLSAVPAGAEGRYKEKVLYSFLGGNDGAVPAAGLIADARGDLYGTTSEGGGSGCNTFGCGTVFKVMPDGKETVLYAFAGGSDGASPYAGLITDAQGNLYGTTASGGNTGLCNGGCGTVFKIMSDGKETPLYAFKDSSDGGNPKGGLIADAQGNLYGTAWSGGSAGFGAVFEVTPQGQETVLYSFTGGTGGGHPETGVIADSQGNFYGSGDLGTHDGCGQYGCGTIFEVTPEGTGSVLYSFAHRKSGAYPLGLISDAEGNLYGAAFAGGFDQCNQKNGCGTVFRVTSQGAETVLHAFKGDNDGAIPNGSLVADAEGNLYGTTLGGGGNDLGTAFEVTPQGKETVLYSFGGGSDGASPEAALMMDTKGNLYGTTASGGASGGYGTVFELQKK